MDRRSAIAALNHAAVNWYLSDHLSSQSLIDAACDALAADVDGEAVVEVASATSKDARSDLEPVVARMAEEFGFAWPPAPGLLPYLTYPRPSSCNEIHFAVRGYDRAEWGPLVGLALLIDGDDWARRTAGVGMPPTPMFAPSVALAATPQPRIVTVSRCECTVLECGSASVRITRDGDLVVWEWLDGDSVWQVHHFDGSAYQRALDQAASDHTWETFPDTVERLVVNSDCGLPDGWTVLFVVPGRDEKSLDVHVSMPGYYLRIPFATGRGNAHAMAVDIGELLASPPWTWSRLLDAGATGCAGTVRGRTTLASGRLPIPKRPWKGLTWPSREARRPALAHRNRSPGQTDIGHDRIRLRKASAGTHRRGGAGQRRKSASSGGSARTSSHMAAGIRA